MTEITKRSQKTSRKRTYGDFVSSYLHSKIDRSNHIPQLASIEAALKSTQINVNMLIFNAQDITAEMCRASPLFVLKYTQLAADYSLVTELIFRKVNKSYLGANCHIIYQFIKTIFDHLRDVELSAECAIAVNKLRRFIWQLCARSITRASSGDILKAIKHLNLRNTQIGKLVANN